LLDFDGYLLLANQLFNDDELVRRSFLQVMTREHPWYRLAKLRSAIRSKEKWADIRKKLSEFGYGRKQIVLASILGRARFIINAAIYLNDRFPKSFFFRWLKRAA